MVRRIQPTTGELLAALAMKSRECQALRRDLKIVDMAPWTHTLVFTASDLAFGEALKPTAHLDESGQIILRLEAEHAAAVIDALDAAAAA